MEKKIDLDEIQMKLYERLKLSGWGNKLKTFILSQDFKHILEVLLKDTQEGHKFVPVLKQLFSCFENCPYDELKVVIVGLAPYPYGPNKNQLLPAADGMAFSCSNTMKPEATLKYILKEVADTVYPDKEYEWNPDLKRWANQGILLLNTSLTTRVGSADAHIELWKPFMTFLYDMLNSYNPGLIVVYLGRIAQEWAPILSDDRYWKLFCTHPSSAAHKNLEFWDSNNLFNKISHLCSQTFKYNIIW